MTEERKAYRRAYWALHPEYRAKEKARQLAKREQRLIRRKSIYRTHPERYVFTGILQRCHNPKDKKFKDYGGRGIKCLFNTFQDFFDCVGPRPSKAYSIDRIDTNGHYEPGNIRWATIVEQNRNRRGCAAYRV